MELSVTFVAGPVTVASMATTSGNNVKYICVAMYQIIKSPIDVAPHNLI